nr:hypothetical protein [Deinococcus sp.]
MALAARYIAERYPGPDPARAHTLGLLHDLGRRSGPKPSHSRRVRLSDGAGIHGRRPHCPDTLLCRARTRHPARRLGRHAAGMGPPGRPVGRGAL